MKRSKRFVLLILAAVALPAFVACSPGGMSDNSGGGLDIGNPTKIAVVDSSNRPVASATVKMILSDSWLTNAFEERSLVADSAVTDKSGIARFDSIPEGAYNLQVDHQTGGAFIRNVSINESLSVSSIAIAGYGSLAGTVIGVSGTPQRIFLEGTAYSAPVNHDGSYAIIKIAAGTFTPIVVSTDSRWSIGTTAEIAAMKTSTGNRIVNFNSLLIDDFEDSTATLNFERTSRFSHIYANKIALNGTVAEYSVGSMGMDGSKALKGLLITKGGWALIGFSLGVKQNGDSLWDLSQASGFSFHAKGNGTLNVSFESDSIDKMGFVKHFSHDVILSSQWQHHAVSFDSLTFKDDPNPSPKITWHESARSIKRIEFNALDDDTVEFWLDNLTVEGIDLSKVYR